MTEALPQRLPFARTSPVHPSLPFLSRLRIVSRRFDVLGRLGLSSELLFKKECSLDPFFSEHVDKDTAVQWRSMEPIAHSELCFFHSSINLVGTHPPSEWRNVLYFVSAGGEMRFLARTSSGKFALHLLDEFVRKQPLGMC